MTPDEYRAMCDAVGVSPYRFAELCGAKPGSRPSWSRDGARSLTVPPAVAAAIRAVHAAGSDMDYADIAALLHREAGALLDAASTT